jgi:hypothetical protein
MSNSDPFRARFGIIAFHKDHPDKNIHMCLYEESPGLNDIKYLAYELEHDPDFGIGEHIIDVFFRYASKREIENSDSLEFHSLE